jgi:hypothetical protein
MPGYADLQVPKPVQDQQHNQLGGQNFGNQPPQWPKGMGVPPQQN